MKHIKRTMNYITRNHALPILTEQTDRFDGHSVQRELKKRYPHIFAAEVGSFATSNDPLHSFSLCFGRWLLATFPDVIRRDGKITSNNLRDRLSSNRAWTRIR